MHNNNPGVLIEYKGHTLTADEFHAFVYGLIGVVFGLSEEVRKAITREPHYFLCGLAVSYGLARLLRK